MQLTGHTVICGWNSQCLKLLQRLEDPAAAAGPVVVVSALSAAEADALRRSSPGLRLSFVRGDFTDGAVLDGAAVATAASAIIVPDDSWPGESGRGKDERTILGALAVKSANPKIRLCAMVLHAENEAHLRRARVDTVLINGEFADLMLARSGQNPQLPDFARSLLSPANPGGLRQLPIPPDFAGRTFAELAAHFAQSGGGILVGILAHSPGGLDGLLSDDEDSDTDSFIKRKFREAAIDLGTAGQSASVRVNPGADYLIGPRDQAFVVG